MTNEELRNEFKKETDRQYDQCPVNYYEWLENRLLNSSVYVVAQAKFCQCKTSAPSTTTGGTVKCQFCGRLCY